MSTTWFSAGAIFDGKTLHSDAALHLCEGVITDIVPRAGLRSDAKVIKIEGLITPGFLDLQVNGGGGTLFNQTPTADGIRVIAKAHRRFGTTAIVPTVITDAPEVLQKAADAAYAAKHEPYFAGLHIEGPHIALSRKGTHDARFIRPLDNTTLDIVTKLRANDIPVMITLAPEAATNAQIHALSTMGAIVSLGHTDAGAEQAKSAFAAGATCVTHLFNAMSQMLGREGGVVGTALNEGTFAGIICDGVHVADDMIGLALRAHRQPDRMFLVSDAMPTVGGPDTFTLYGAEIRLDDGRLVNANGNLAGAHTTQAAGVARLVQQIGIGIEQALRMAVTTPATLIGADQYRKIIGRRAEDVIILDESLSFAGTLRDLI